MVLVVGASSTSTAFSEALENQAHPGCWLSVLPQLSTVDCPWVIEEDEEVDKTLRDGPSGQVAMLGWTPLLWYGASISHEGGFNGDTDSHVSTIDANGNPITYNVCLSQR